MNIMKKVYMKPQQEVMEMVSKACLLNGSNTPTTTGTTINVDEWQDD